MVCVLSVAEKPSVAKELAGIIGKVPPESIRRAGQSPYNPIFHIPRCDFRDQQVEMQITSVAGHMMELEFDPAFKNWQNCSPIDLFTAPVQKYVRKDCELIQKTLKAEAKKSQILLLWLDCDLEGENIAFEVIKVCLEANPRLDVFRARFSALIERDIFRTLKHPDRPNKDMNDAVEARQEIDLRIGAAFTRFQTLRLQKRFEEIKGVVSYGPCQFPTLGFVVERDLSIKSFIPEKFWSIQCESEFPHPDYTGNDKKQARTLKIKFYWERGVLYDQFTTFVLYESLFEGAIAASTNGAPTALAKVIHRQENPTSKWRPVPLNTIEFQILASRYLRMGSEHAMTIAESLYQRGILSYPRTETNFFKEGFELQTILQDFLEHPDFGTYVHGLVYDEKFQWPRKGNKDDQAHPPIHPTKSIPLNSLENEEERQIYELVCRHFFACCSKDAKGSSTTLKIQIPAYPVQDSIEDSESPAATTILLSPVEIFTASGLMVLERNWLDIYSKYDSWHGNKLPTLRVGDTFSPSLLEMTTGETHPPSPISESELITAMDHNGIGTDATIATHISTIQTREYAIKDQRNCFLPTPLGLALVEGYNAMGYQLNKPYLRANIEADCQKVARGLLSKQKAVEQSLSIMKNCFINCVKEVNKLDAAVAKYFGYVGSSAHSAYQTVQRQFSRCGQCQTLMDLRVETPAAGGGDNNNNSNRRYLYCTQCQKSYLVPHRGDLVPHPQYNCVICRYQVVIVRNPETNKEHTICPYCFSTPPPPPDGLEFGGLQEFRCFTCANSDCPLSGRLAGSDTNLSVCIDSQRNGFMRLKKNTKGYLLSCSTATCKQSWWLPKFIKQVKPQEGKYCSRCERDDALSIVLLMISVNLSQAPRGLAPEQVICPVCDPLWKMIDHPSLFAKRSRAIGSGYSGSTATPNMTTINRSVVSTAMSATSMTGPAKVSLEQFIPSTTAATTHSAGRIVNNSSSTVVPYPNYPVPPTPIINPPAMVPMEIEDLTIPYHAIPPYSSSSRPAYPPPSTTPYLSNSSSSMPIVIDDGPQHPNCDCGVPSKLCTVTKESANKGRTFFGCATRTGGCRFFMWTEDFFNPSSASKPSAAISVSGRKFASSTPKKNSSSSYRHFGGGVGEVENIDQNASFPNCNCGESTMRLIVGKEGPNKGRPFYSCKKSREEKCNFFQWADEADKRGGRSNVTPSRKTSTTSGSWNQKGKTASHSPENIVCTYCREAGHYARQCPNK